MGRIEFEPWEPEESVGKLWHALASRLDAPKAHDEARVDLSEVAGRLAVLFRGLGGAPSVEFRPARDEVSQPAVFALGCALWQAIGRLGRCPPDAVAGYRGNN